MPFSRFSQKLNELKSQSLLRTLQTVESAQGRILIHEGREYLNFSSNNYLALAEDSRVQEAFIKGVEQYGVGSGAARLVTGSMAPFHELESALAKFKSCEAALVFNSGYHANLGALGCLPQEDDVVFSDQLNHASIIDGLRLSKAKRIRYEHQNLDELQTKLKQERFNLKANSKIFIVTESLYSMDGDLCDLKTILDLAVEYDALVYLDEAHATGVLGKTGAGLAENFRDHPGFKTHLIQMGTLGKALGCFGAYIAGPQVLIDYLINRARPFIYTTALPPAVAVAALTALKIVQSGEQQKRLWGNIEFFKSQIPQSNFNSPNSPSIPHSALRTPHSPILPLIIGSATDTLALSEALWKQGLWVKPIRPPTVPKRTSRLRMTLMASHTKEDIQYLAEACRVQFAQSSSFSL